MATGELETVPLLGFTVYVMSLKELATRKTIPGEGEPEIHDRKRMANLVHDVLGKGCYEPSFPCVIYLAMRETMMRLGKRLEDSLDVLGASSHLFIFLSQVVQRNLQRLSLILALFVK